MKIGQHILLQRHRLWSGIKSVVFCIHMDSSDTGRNKPIKCQSGYSKPILRNKNVNHTYYCKDTDCGQELRVWSFASIWTPKILTKTTPANTNLVETN